MGEGRPQLAVQRADVHLRRAHHRHGAACQRVGGGGGGRYRHRRPAREAARLFDRFHQIRGAHSRSHEGGGIGLALVAGLHSGTITADSTPNVDTTFTITLPLGSAHLPADHIAPTARVVGVTERAATFVEEALRWLPPRRRASQRAAIDAGHRGDARTAPGLGAGRRRQHRHARIPAASARFPVLRAGCPRQSAALDAATAQPPDLITSNVMM
ncbi:MAG: hypothetical protein JO287_24795 [Pseudonocardiales bacterium]|nr:hypothetical protein [Pseudonocardiales bacterium]